MEPMPPAPGPAPGTVITAQLRRWARTATLVFNGIWIALALISLITALALAPAAAIQPVLAIGYEGSRGDSAIPLVAAQAEGRS